MAGKTRRETTIIHEILLSLIVMMTLLELKSKLTWNKEIFQFIALRNTLHAPTMLQIHAEASVIFIDSDIPSHVLRCLPKPQIKFRSQLLGAELSNRRDRHDSVRENFSTSIYCRNLAEKLSEKMLIKKKF